MEWLCQEASDYVIYNFSINYIKIKYNMSLLQ